MWGYWGFPKEEPKKPKVISENESLELKLRLSFFDISGGLEAKCPFCGVQVYVWGNGTQQSEPVIGFPSDAECPHVFFSNILLEEEAQPYKFLSFKLDEGDFRKKMEQMQNVAVKSLKSIAPRHDVRLEIFELEPVPYSKEEANKLIEKRLKVKAILLCPDGREEEYVFPVPLEAFLRVSGRIGKAIVASIREKKVKEKKAS